MSVIENVVTRNGRLLWKAMRPEGPHVPRLLESLWHIRSVGRLQFLMDQWRLQGDLPQVRLGHYNLVFVIHPDHVRQVFVDNRQGFDKLQSWEGTRQLLLGAGLIAAQGQAWKRQRRLMSGFFTPRSVEQYYELFLQEAEQTAQRWEALALRGEPVDMVEEMMRVAASIILRSMFGASLGDETLFALQHDIEALMAFTHDRELLPIKPPLWAPLPSHVRYQQARAHVHGFIHGMIRQRRSMPEAQWPADLLSKLMMASDHDTGERASDALIADEALGIFIAGHETTARMLSFLWYQLHEHQEVAERLHAELDSVLSREQLPGSQDLRRLPYMTRALKEVLRLYPPSPLAPRDPVGEQAIGERALPTGTVVMVFPYATHRHPDFWEAPERFEPDRFLPGAEEARHPFAYHPFGGGQRICLGNSFAMMEAEVLTAVLARRFSLRLVTGHKPRVDAGGVLVFRNGLPMMITARRI